jgi:hypothetical protein
MMKKIFYNIVILLMSVTLFSCEDYLDISPDLEIDEDDVFDSYDNAQGYLDNCYNALTDHSRWDGQKIQRPHVAAISDEADLTYTWSPIYNIMNPGQWLDQESSCEVGYTDSNTGTYQGRVVANAFYCLRIANKLLENVPDMDITQDEQDELMGQAYFMRSWWYFELIRRWGGMFLIDKAYDSDDVLDLERLTYSESSEWLIEGLDQAIELLPDAWDDANKGRADKVAAMSVKSMAALYAASPLMQNGPYTITDQDYSVEWSELAAKYAAEVLDYIDATIPDRAVTGEDMDADEQMENYTSIFYHYPEYCGAEDLWYVNSTGMSRLTDIVIHFQNIHFSGKTGNYGWACTTPSQNLVDMFEFADGTPFDWDNSDHVADPYTNRDPRFYNNILYPGGSHGVDASGDPMYLETWVGGEDYNTTLTRSIPTGYMCTKWWWADANRYNSSAYKSYYYNGVYIRTTQIWLDLAEAMNEAYGPDSDPDGLGYTAVQALNKVRNRVGMPDVADEYTGSKEALRDRIRNERGVELMFENHRWFDIRRWMIAEDVFSDTYPIKGVDVEVLSGSSPADYEYSFAKKDVTTAIRVFAKRNYWYPVAYDHTTQYENFKQNYGW